MNHENFTKCPHLVSGSLLEEKSKKVEISTKVEKDDPLPSSTGETNETESEESHQDSPTSSNESSSDVNNSNSTQNAPPPIQSAASFPKPLSPSSSTLQSLLLCNHKEVAQRLIYIPPSAQFGQDNGAIVRAAILG